MLKCFVMAEMTQRFSSRPVAEENEHDMGMFNLHELIGVRREGDLSFMFVITHC
jgi:hypothetical protein